RFVTTMVKTRDIVTLNKKCGSSSAVKTTPMKKLNSPSSRKSKAEASKPPSPSPAMLAPFVKLKLEVEADSIPEFCD
ncbi:hypothetical protein PanWU01x14_000320, partial [Parasponia andersonii]